MDTNLFKNWFFGQFVKHVRDRHGSDVDIVLILDNAPAHPSSDILCTKDGKISCILLPPNVTSILQPMNQSPIETFKRIYRRELLRRLIIADDDQELTEFKKSLNLKDCIYLSAEAWSNVKEVTLKNAWNKLWPNDEIESSEQISEDINLNEIVNNIPQLANCTEEVNNWINSDNLDPGYQNLDDDQIISKVIIEKVETNSSEEESDNETQKCPTHAEAFTALETALLWFECQPESTGMSLLNLKKIRDLAARKRMSNLIQPRITDFLIKKMIK